MDGVPFDRICPPATARVHAPLSCRARPPPAKFALADGGPVSRERLCRTSLDDSHSRARWPSAHEAEDLMHEGDTSPDRRRVQEDEYFRRRD
jgi:hypothetical protein